MYSCLCKECFVFHEHVITFAHARNTRGCAAAHTTTRARFSLCLSHGNCRAATQLRFETECEEEGSGRIGGSNPCRAKTQC